MCDRGGRDDRPIALRKNSSPSYKITLTILNQTMIPTTTKEALKYHQYKRAMDEEI